MKRLLIFLAALSCAGFSVATAEQYWITYEGDDFPEAEGWTREFGDEHGADHGGAVRWIEDGALVIDSMYNPLVYDYSAVYRSINPAPAELFVMRWRMRVDQVTEYGDPAVAVFSDDGWGAAFEYWPSRVQSGYEDGLFLPLTPGQFHTFEFLSWDMRSYEFMVDGEFAWAGAFRDVSIWSEVSWGDGTQGAASIAQWDYFRFGVVPEPSGGFLMGYLVLAALCKRR